MKQERDPYFFQAVYKSTDTLGGISSLVLRTHKELLHKEIKSEIILLRPHASANQRGFHHHAIHSISEWISYLEQHAPLTVLLLCETSYVRFILAAGLLKSKGHSINIILDVQSDSENEYYRWLPELESVVDSIICSSQKIYETVAHRLSNPELAHLITRGVEIPMSDPKTSFTTPIKIIYTGRLEQSQKNIRAIIPFIKQLQKRQIKFHFDIFGDGPEKDFLLRKLEKEVKSKIICFHGKVHTKDLERHYQNADIFVSFSRYEGLSQSLLEAMSNACIPIIPPVSGASDVITNNINGYIRNPEHPSEYCNAIEDLMSSKEKYKKTSAASRATIIERFSISQTIEKLSPLICRQTKKPTISYSEISSKLLKSRIRHFLSRLTFVKAKNYLIEKYY